MSEASSKTICVADNGLFVEFAIRLSREFKRVLYWSPWEKCSPVINDAVIGDGIEGIERIDNIWDHKTEIDAFCFPDVLHSGEQMELIRQGFPVWGSRKADSLELGRAKFKQVLLELGLEVGPYRVCKGMDDLREYLKGKKDCFVKLSRYRGSMETWHWVDWDTSRYKLDELAVKFGPFQKIMRFVVEDAIEAVTEWGYDGYFSGGKFPKLSAHGPEVKDKCYAASIVAWDDLPKEVREVNEAMQPLLAKYGYCNFFSTELRMGKDGSTYFIDPCVRMPSPAGEAQMELYSNLGEIIWGGANAQSVDPVPAANFCVEAIIDHTDDEQNCRQLKIPEEIRQWVKLYNVCEVDGFQVMPALTHGNQSIGALLGIGDTMEDAIAHLNENAEALKDQPISVHIDSLIDALKEIEKSEKEGIEFSEDQMPEPETVLQDA